MKDDRKSSKYPAPGETFIPYQFGNSALLQRNVLRDPDLLPNEKNMWILLSHYAGEDGTCNPSYGALGNGLGMTRRNAIYTIEGLIEKGFIRKEPAIKRTHTSQFFFIWRESFAENPFNGNGRGDTHVTISHDQLVKDTSPVTSETRFTSNDQLVKYSVTTSETHFTPTSETHFTRSEKESEKEKPPPPLPRKQFHNVCPNDPDESKGGGGLFVDGEKKKPSAQEKALLKEYLDLSVQREIHKGTEITNKAAYRSKIKCRVIEETDQETFLEELEELRAWKREQDEEKELKEISRQKAIERENRKQFIQEEYRENCEPGFICLSEDEFYAMKHEEFSRENDHQGLELLVELFPDAHRRMIQEQIRSVRESLFGQETSGSKRKGKKPEPVKLSFEAFTEVFDQLERNGCRDNTVWSQLKNDHLEFYQKWEAKRAHDDMLDKFVRAIRSGMSDHETLENDKALHPDIWSEAVKEAEKPISVFMQAY